MITKKCKYCNEEFQTVELDQEFCSCRCSAFYNNRKRKLNGTLKHSKETKEKISKTLKAHNHKKLKYCKVCGQTECKHPEICKQYLIRKKSINLKKLGFDFSVFGTESIIEEYWKVYAYLFDMYCIKQKSLKEICVIHNMTCESSLAYILDMYQIERRSISDAVTNAVIQGKFKTIQCINAIYKHGWHTTWDSRQVYYRSSYELELCKQLDSKKIHYEMEFLRISYYDTQRKKLSVSIVDFYIPSSNTIIEVKSSFTYNKINMIDRFKAYKQLGYNDYHLFYEGKDYGKRLPETREENKFYYKV